MFYTGLLTLSSPGPHQFYLGFQPIGMEFNVSQIYGFDDWQNHLSLGATDGTRQNCQSVFSDELGHGLCRNVNTKCVSHYERQGDGAIREIISANKVTFISTGFRINVLTGTPRYQVAIKAWS